MPYAFGRRSTQLVCPTCKLTVNTRLKYKASNQTHILALVCCLFCLCPCALALYCTSCARNVEHYCPACDTYLGRFER